MDSGTIAVNRQRTTFRSRSRRLSALSLDTGLVFSLVVIIALIIIAVTAPFISPYEPTAQGVAKALSAPSWAHPFGTDEFGRDVFSRILHGTRPALLIGFFSVMFAVAFGVPIGLFAGLVGGWIDTAVSAVVDVMLSFPTLLMAILIVTLAGSGVTVISFAIGFSQMPIFVRLARGSALVIREMDYVSASRTFGAGRLYILWRHILPNAAGPLIIMATLGIAGAIREEAGLSFLGLGVQPPNPSWGNLIQEGVKNILDAPWLAFAPGLLLTASVLAFNMLGDTARDILDPRNIVGRADPKEAQR